MKNRFEIPQLEIILFSNDDIIMTSAGDVPGFEIPEDPDED